MNEPMKSIAPGLGSWQTRISPTVGGHFLMITLPKSLAQVARPLDILARMWICSLMCLWAISILRVGTTFGGGLIRPLSTNMPSLVFAKAPALLM